MGNHNNSNLSQKIFAFSNVPHAVSCPIRTTEDLQEELSVLQVNCVAIVKKIVFSHCSSVPKSIKAELFLLNLTFCDLELVT